MFDKNLKVTVQRAANGFIAKLNDGQPHVFKTEDEVVEWFGTQLKSPGSMVEIRPERGR